MHALRPAIIYFLSVFASGFLLGAIRVTLIVPRVGNRTAELLEMPLMLAASLRAARWIAWRFREARTSEGGLAIGSVALGLMLMAELAVGMGLRGAALADVFWNKDPVSGTAYYLSLLIFGFMPWIVSSRWSTT
jgi:hypothetical protein